MVALSSVQNLPATFAKVGKAQALPVVNAAPPAPDILTSRVARESGLSQTQYLATTLNVQRIQNALRTAERGDTWLFFTIVRDMISGYTHLGTEWNKRKMVIAGQPMSLIPADPNSEEDKIACQVVREAIDNCRNWYSGVTHLLDATLMPLSAAEKIWEPVSKAEAQGQRFKYLKRFRLKELAPISYNLLCFKIPYAPGVGGNANPATNFDADAWESWLRFYDTEPNGAVNYGTLKVYEPDPAKHIIHRGNLLSPTIPPNFGGHIRAILFWWLLATQDRDWWALMMSKYGMPIPVGKVNSSNKNSVTDMQSALALGMQIGGIVVDKNATIEWGTVAGTDGSNQHKIFSEFCNSEVSKIVVGQVTSSTPPKGGLAGGMAEQSESVRDDIRMYDTTTFANTIETQLFQDILSLNGYRGRVKVAWGGLKPEQMKLMGQMAKNAFDSGMRLTENGMQTWNERAGMEFERIPANEMPGAQESEGGNSKGGEDE